MKAGFASRVRRSIGFQPSLGFVLLAALLALLWLAGGASRPDALGQVVVRGAAWAALILLLLFGRQIGPVSRPVALVVFAALALALAQLVPLPPAVWQALPGRGLLLEAAIASGQPQPWRPLSMVPDATFNAAASLVVPLAILFLVAGLRDDEKGRLPGILLVLILLSSLVGLLQFSGVPFDNPLINDSRGEVAGTFANRNHFAVFVAFGCLLAPVWAFSRGAASAWRGLVASGLLLLFALTILASGSRAGLLAGALALAIGLILAWAGIRRMLAHYPRWMTWALLGGIVAAIAAAVLLSVAAGRAISIDRAFTFDQGPDMRVRGLPIVVEMIREYLPFGSGLGGFDPVFRIHEPLHLLKPTYFNHAHNDWFEIVLDAGLPGLLLLLIAVAWWSWASVRAWRRSDPHRFLPRLGSAILLLLLFASTFDYPARTPMMMAMAVIAGIWLSSRAPAADHAALPASKQYL